MKKREVIEIVALILLACLSHVGRSIWDYDGIEFAETIDYAGTTQELLLLLEEVEENTVKALTFTVGNSVLEHSEKVILQGELDFTGVEEDMIILRKTGDKWVEIGRYLKE